MTSQPDRYQPRAASASQPNTLKTSGFRSKLYSWASRAATLILSQASAIRLVRPGYLVDLNEIPGLAYVRADDGRLAMAP